MKIASSVIGLLTAAFLLLPSTSHAQQQAFTAKSVHVRAGPAIDYPVVAILAPGTPLMVEGCLSDYTWCEVVLPDSTHGWVYAGNLNYDYNGAYVPILDYGSSIGFEVLSFSLGFYWDTYYRGRPWYRDRQHWIDHPVYPRPRVGPRPDHVPPPGGYPPGGHPPGGHAPDRSHPQGQVGRPAARSPGIDRSAKPSSRGKMGGEPPRNLRNK
jgi:uncharacterized protein YraI